MGQNMGQAEMRKIRGNFFACKTKKSSENLVVFGTFMATTNGLDIAVKRTFLQ